MLGAERGGVTMATTAQTGPTSTGASDLEYDIVAEMHELLQGNEALDRYVNDACQANDDEAAQCFRAICQQNRDAVGKLRKLLAERLQRGAIGPS
jgi:hypothetical protein